MLVSIRSPVERGRVVGDVSGGLVEGPADTRVGVVGRWIHPASLSRAFGRAVKASGLPRTRFHDLRHTYATILLGAGVPAKVVSERLGHSNIRTTLDIYSHVTPRMDEAAATTLGAMLGGASAEG